MSTPESTVEKVDRFFPLLLLLVMISLVIGTAIGWHGGVQQASKDACGPCSLDEFAHKCGRKVCTMEGWQ